jgi:pimeloyl-ACP methyl ester carboxylesterase
VTPENDAVTTAPAPTPGWFFRALEQQPTGDYFEQDGAQIHFLHWPEKSHGANKPVLLFVHGFRGHARWWSYVAPFFLAHYRVYALDFSGMGDSDHRASYHNDTHGNEILGLLDHLRLDEVTIVAHSFGGGRSFRAAVRAPGRFKKIIAIDSHISFVGHTIDKTDPAPQHKQKFYASQEAGLARFRLVPQQPISQPYAVDYIGRHSLKPEQDQWTWKFDPQLLVDNFISYDGDEILAGVSCPVDYIWGENSVIMNNRNIHRIHGALANPGKFVMIPDGHHHLMISHPEAVISTLQALL